MASSTWYLGFRAAKGAPLEVIGDVLADEADGPWTARDEGWCGNPRDGYARRRHLLASGAQCVLRASALQWAYGPEEDGPAATELLDVEVEAGSVGARLDGWRRIAARLAALGYADRTLAGWSSRIVDEVAASGDTALADALRREVTDTLIAECEDTWHVAISDARPHDLAAVLRAYTHAAEITSVSFSNLGLTALPPELARFPKVRSLSLYEPAIQARALRGWSFPELTELGLYASGTTEVSADDLRGAPALTTLTLGSTPLRALDPDLRAACPALARVDLHGTPLAKDEAAFRALAARWPDVRLDR
ncbi:MAG: hypothetical protein KF729_32950 [Sandaracinaceae bacterium]|nr:hypothetical protein [Sandaracinaceae bacterium]